VTVSGLCPHPTTQVLRTHASLTSFMSPTLAGQSKTGTGDDRP
jgi:hypothetical protein